MFHVEHLFLIHNLSLLGIAQKPLNFNNSREYILKILEIPKNSLGLLHSNKMILGCKNSLNLTPLNMMW